jgi:hypothetical protein
MKTENEESKLAEKMADDILKSLGQEDNPLRVLIVMYIENQLKSLK